MPVRWTPETNEILLVKILETSDVTANVKAISEAWPTDRERPTPRAISERLFKIRANCKKADGKSTLTVSNGEKRTTPKASAQKAAGGKGKGVSTAATTNGTNTTNGKRKRQASTQSIDDDVPHDSEPEIIKAEDSDTETGDKPIKSAKKAKTAQGNFQSAYVGYGQRQAVEEEYAPGDAI